MNVTITAAHWLYLLGLVVVLITMGRKKNPLVFAVLFTGLVTWAFTGSLKNGFAGMFNGTLAAASDLFSIVLIIALITAMLNALRHIGADVLMVAPFQRVMRNGHLSFVILAAVTYVLSLFFWPTPAVPLIAAVLIPVAIRSGLSPMGVGLAVGIAGQGMALSSDYVIRVAPSISAKASGADAGAIANRSLVLSLIVGLVALTVAYLIERRAIREPGSENLSGWERSATAVTVRGTMARIAMGRRSTAAVTPGGDAGTAAGAATEPDGHGRTSTATLAESDEPDDEWSATPSAGERSRGAVAMAITVPACYLLLVAYMVVAKLSEAIPDLAGGEAAALVGGLAVGLCFLASLVTSRTEALSLAADSIVGGFGFAIKVMAIVFPIAGFFFLGNPAFAGQIMGTAEGVKAPGFLFDLVTAGQSAVPHNGLLLGFGMLLAGMIGGLDGAGFSVLPLTGSLAGAFGGVGGAHTATLAAIGQMGAIWVGGGTLAAWSSIVAVAAFARVSPVDLARRCLVPVLAGLVVATLAAVLLM